MFLEWLRIVGVLVVGAVFWLAYIDLKDRARPEPRARLLGAFLLGMLAALLAMTLFRWLDSWGVRLEPEGGLLASLRFCVLAIGGIEEGAKLLVFAAIVRRWHCCDEPIDGFVYAGAIACGFATVENLHHLPSLPVAEQLARVATLPITHTLFAAIWGLELTRPGRSWRTVGLAVLLSAGLHGAYDWAVLVLDLPVASSLLVLVVWIVVLTRLRQISPVREPARIPLAGMLLLGLVGVVGLLALVSLRPTTAESPTIWFADGGVLGPVRGDVLLQVGIYDGGTGIERVHVTVDGEALEHRPGGWLWPSAQMEDGAHILRVEAWGRGHIPSRAVRFGTVFSDNIPARVLISASSARPRQGGSFVPLLRPTQPVQALQAVFDGSSLPLDRLTSEDGKLTYRGMRGVWVKHAPGPEVLDLYFEELDGRQRHQQIVIQVQKTDFSGSKRVLNIPLKKRSLMKKTKKRARGSDQARRDGAYAYPIRSQLWRGDFIWPTVGPRSSRFGKVRTYNTGVQRHHLGVDISNEPGTPILAANDGIVTLSDHQRAFGNVVIIGHGLGMSTSYNHMLEPGVPRGTVVKKGDPIGLMGSTGLSTGPHLHWGMELGGVAVDAEQWMSHQFDGGGVDDFE